MLAGCSKDEILNHFAMQKVKFTTAQVKKPESVPQKTA